MPAVSLRISELHPDEVHESVKLAMEKGICSIDSTGNSNNEKTTSGVIQELCEQKLIQSRYEFFYAINIYGPNLEQNEITLKLNQSLSNLKILYANLVIVHTAITNYSVPEILAYLRCHVDHQSMSVGVVVWDSDEMAQRAAEGGVTIERNDITIWALMPYEAEEDCPEFPESGETVETDKGEDSPIFVLHNKDLEICKPVGGVVSFHSQTLRREVHRRHFEVFRADSCHMSRVEFSQFDFTRIGLPGHFLKEDDSCSEARISANHENDEAQQSVGPVDNMAQYSIGSVDVEAQETVEQINDDTQQLIEQMAIDRGKKVVALGILILFIIIYVVLSILPCYA